MIFKNSSKIRKALLFLLAGFLLVLFSFIAFFYTVYLGHYGEIPTEKELAKIRNNILFKIGDKIVLS